jgi:exonuclease III
LRIFNFLVLSSVFLGSNLCAETKLGVAAFNMAWTGGAQDFQLHMDVCNSLEKPWCDSVARPLAGAAKATDAEVARARACSSDFEKKAGGFVASMLVAPCSAYRITKDTAGSYKASDYQIKLQGLLLTVDEIIKNQGVKIIAFQEVRSAEVAKLVLGSNVSEFDVCAAQHNAFQTVAIAWHKSLSSTGCKQWDEIAVKEKLGNNGQTRKLRPGLSVELMIGASRVTFLNIHLKSKCASLKDSGKFKGQFVNDSSLDCEILSRQVVPLENAIETIAKSTPKFIVLGDFNRRLDEEQDANPSAAEVRANKTNPASINKVDSNGRPATKYLWQEISDGNPSLIQVPLVPNPICKGFPGLDHILLSKQLWEIQPAKVSSTKSPVVSQTGQKIETSDHCPRVTQLVF